MTLAFARAQEVSCEGVLIRHDPEPWLKGCQDTDSDQRAYLNRMLRLG